MKYDFDTVIDRRNTNCMKWNIGENELAMWVADMDFKAAPEIIDAMQNRLDHGVFGYAEVPDSWYDAYINWWDRRHGMKMEKEHLIFSTGVIPSISSSVRKFTTPNENVVIQTPVYNVFYNCIENNGCRVLPNSLILKDGEYFMDFEDLEKKFSNPQTTLMLLSNPQNPGGKIWAKEDLAKIGELAKKYNVIVIADEIHCDITMPGKSYTPFASVSDVCKEVSITLISPTKAFNLAGIQTSAVYAPNPALRNKINRALNTDEVAEPNVFATVAAEAAFTKGEEWLDCLREYLYTNRKIVEEFLSKELPEIKLIKGEATYLLWLDISAISNSGSELSAYLRKNANLFLSEGNIYGPGGETFLRMNIACPAEQCKEGLKRLKAGIDSYRK